MTDAIPPQTLDLSQRERTARECLLPWIARHRLLREAVVVDFGCGPGAYTAPLAEHAGRVIAVDIDDQEVAILRQRLAGAGNVTACSGSFERLVEFVRTEAPDGVDVFLLAATLEHMTISERLAVLGLADDVLRPDGVLVIWETPNRLLWGDHHTSREPFFQQLPEQLALEWVDRVQRAELRQAIRAGGPLQLWRWGRGASFHELEIALDGLDGRIVAGGYDPDTIAVRPVDRDELALARYMDRELPGAHPAFSRYWLDLIIRRSPAPARRWLRPWPFETVDGEAVGMSRWDLLHFARAGAWVRVQLREPTTRLLVGVEVAGSPTTLAVRGERWAQIGELRVTDESDARTAYELVDLSEPATVFALQALDQAAVVSFVGIQEGAGVV